MTSDGNRKKRSSGSGSSRKRSGSSNTGRSSSRSSNNKKNNVSSKRKKTSPKEEALEFDYVKVLIYIGVFAFFVLMFLFSLGIFEGGFGMFITNVLRGLFGINSLLIPVIAVLMAIYCIVKDTTKKTVFNVVSAVLLTVSIGMIAHLFAYSNISEGTFTESVKMFFHEGKGGGLIFGLCAYFINITCGRALIWILSIFLILASIAVLFGKYIYRFARILIAKYTDLEGYDFEEEKEYTDREIRKLRAKEEARKKKVSYQITDNTDDEKNYEKENEKEKIIDVNSQELRTLSEEIMDNSSKKQEVKEKNKEKVKEKDLGESNDIHQIHAKNLANPVNNDEIKPINVYGKENNTKPLFEEDNNDIHELNIREVPKVSMTDTSIAMTQNTRALPMEGNSNSDINEIKTNENVKADKPYKFPPVSLLNKASKTSKRKGDDIIETANKLKETLATFGVEVSIDPANCSKGPAVTRYELTPAPGVKVAKIVSLSDDIKLSLGAADIRIEAPIPGKSAVGIEVPNSESSAVPFRDLIESNEFASSKSKISFAVGKDLAGDTVIADIAKMPHLLIAGATGSGKSVCINTIIMSILYKAHPDDVKLILIDPKVVELSVYNGIPHLLLPVVTDPKKASASLKWGVTEMENRYKKFAEEGVRDLKGYNEKYEGNEKLPQIIIIVDELADLMMVAGKEVEESICRLAQLARAAGIHLIIATQRPSVDVITGLIKANMPSRIAFSVSSGIDSRTILDTNGAEKLLGKGDMLFFPQGLNKPSRVQGCFVSDNEVLNVVDFIKNQNIKGYDERIINDVNSGGSSVASAVSGGQDTDELFAQAGLFIIGKEKASIGALQRAFKIGFNRAARIMDQLEENGVVGPEEGTKPRKILMSEAEFNSMINSQ